MVLQFARTMAEDLLKQHNLDTKNWTFGGFDNAKTRLGVCIYRRRNVTKTIQLSKICTENRTEHQVKMTILHEIAHALDYENRGRSGHDYTWKQLCLSIGGDGQTCNDLDEETRKQIYKYNAVCPNHGTIGGWTRKPKNIDRGRTFKCKKCGSRIVVIEN